MSPNRYLNYGSGLVFLILGSIISMNWYVSNQVVVQHATYVEQQADLQILDRLQASINRIVSSSNEYALITISTGAAEPETGTPDEAGGEDGEENTAEAAAHELQLIEDAAAAFRADLKLLAASRRHASGNSSPTTAIGTDFQSLLDSNQELITIISNPAASRMSIFETKEEQETFESSLLATIASERDTVRAEIVTRGENLATEIGNLENYGIVAGLLAVVILTFSSIFVGRRISQMFEEIDSQRLRIETSNGELNTAIEALQSLQKELVDKEKLSTLGRLTATVSHELRNPLAAIRNSAFILKQGVAHLPELAEFTTRIERNILRCDDLIADLLEYTRSRELQKQPVNLSPWLKAIAGEQNLPPGVTVAFDVDSAPVMADVDELRLQRAFINLIENAAQAIDASKRPGEIRISCHTRGDNAVITIADDGPGIPEKIRPDVFKPLFTTKSFGAGLGLPITRNLVMQHGGEIELESSPGKGATFKIRLPLNSKNDIQRSAA